MAASLAETSREILPIPCGPIESLDHSGRNNTCCVAPCAATSAHERLSLMPWRTLIALSASAAVTVTAFEQTILGNAQMTYVSSPGMFLRIVGATAATIGLVCFVAGLAGSVLYRAAGLSRHRAAAAGVLAPAIPMALYLGGVDLAWDYDQYWLWFVIGTPLAFACVSRLLEALAVAHCSGCAVGSRNRFNSGRRLRSR